VAFLLRLKSSKAGQWYRAAAPHDEPHHERQLRLGDIMQARGGSFQLSFAQGLRIP
jgi:hypothetical protein